jgi:sterol 22-desaturase
MAIVQNASFVSPPLAHTGFGTLSDNAFLNGVLSTITSLSGCGWTIALTVFLGLVAYDQCMFQLKNIPYICSIKSPNFLPVSYLWQKGSIVGPTFKTPFIGPFLQSVNPKFSEYQAKWASGDLSCVSVFHKYEQLCNTYP